MKGLFYGIAVIFALSLTACSDAKFSNSSASNQKTESIGDPNHPPKVDEVPDSQMDEAVDYYKCGDYEKRTCPNHSSANDPANAKKALVCHVPASGKGVNICISVNALKAHIAQEDASSGHHSDDYFGPCKSASGEQ